ncbi:hypothetical protein MKEN_00554300 [Mycena kentingensis (nom. inval.)]|nr:hypothetical protein MKEN_00554300 [Mycena kentingensis (nom. inval.)]
MSTAPTFRLSLSSAEDELLRNELDTVLRIKFLNDDSPAIRDTLYHAAQIAILYGQLNPSWFQFANPISNLLTAVFLRVNFDSLEKISGGLATELRRRQDLIDRFQAQTATRRRLIVPAPSDGHASTHDATPPTYSQVLSSPPPVRALPSAANGGAPSSLTTRTPYLPYPALPVHASPSPPRSPMNVDEAHAQAASTLLSITKASPSSVPPPNLAAKRRIDDVARSPASPVHPVRPAPHHPSQPGPSRAMIASPVPRAASPPVRMQTSAAMPSRPPAPVPTSSVGVVPTRRPSTLGASHPTVLPNLSAHNRAAAASRAPPPPYQPSALAYNGAVSYTPIFMYTTAGAAAAAAVSSSAAAGVAYAQPVYAQPVYTQSVVLPTGSSNSSSSSSSSARNRHARVPGSLPQETVDEVTYLYGNLAVIDATVEHLRDRRAWQERRLQQLLGNQQAYPVGSCKMFLPAGFHPPRML